MTRAGTPSIMRTCCNDPRWARWKVIDANGITPLMFTLTRAGARRWAKRYARSIVV